MSKIIYLCFALFAFYHTSAPTRRKVNYSIEIDYRLSSLPDSNSSQRQEEDMELLINPSESVFRSKKLGVLDSVLNEPDNTIPINVAQDILSRNQTDIRYHIYKTPDSIITQEDYHLNFNKEKMYYVEKEAFNWQISTDTLSIGGMTCQKATTDFGGRQWIAWFSPEVPISDGPYKFRGLPGLIMKIYDSQKQWSFDFQSLRKIQRNVTVRFDPKNPPNFLQKKEVFADKKNYTRNRFKIEEASGFMTPGNEQTRRNALERDRRRAEMDNNWIEKYDAIEN